jgi:hypothetical protein
MDKGEKINKCKEGNISEERAPESWKNGREMDYNISEHTNTINNRMEGNMN